MDTVEITRYPNRRLYDRSQKRYVTIGEIEDIILRGRNVLVRDSKSNDDLTRVILLQILLERHPERLALIPVAVLQEMLRADQVVLDWLRLYFGQARVMLQGLPGPSSAALLPGMDLWRTFLAGRPSADTEAQQETPLEEPPPDAQTAESAPHLALRLAELEQRIRQLEADQRPLSEDAPADT